MLPPRWAGFHTGIIANLDYQLLRFSLVEEASPWPLGPSRLGGRVTKFRVGPFFGSFKGSGCRQFFPTPQKFVLGSCLG